MCTLHGYRWIYMEHMMALFVLTPEVQDAYVFLCLGGSSELSRHGLSVCQAEMNRHGLRHPRNSMMCVSLRMR